MQKDFQMYVDCQFAEKFVLINKNNEIISAIIW